jgi:alpha-mannosidase
MVSITTVTSTYCFVESPTGLAQVVWLDIDGSDDDVEAWVEGARVACPVRWRGRVSGNGKAKRVQVAVVAPEGAREGERIPIEAVGRGRTGEARQRAELEVHEPGWTMYMVSHFHYDPVWWNTQAAYTSGWDDLIWAQDKRDTFQHTGLVLVEAHLERARLDPDYKFVLAEVDYLKPFWDLYPDRREELRRLLAEGRMEVVGGTYNEPNTNLTAFETAARCAIYGVGFQREVFGASPESAWQLDVFAHDPSFPSLMASCGVTSSSWARGPFHQWGPKHHTGSTEWMQFPSEFEWLSPDGKGLLTSYMPDHYSAGWQLDLAGTLDEAVERAYSLFCDLAAVSATKATLLPVGTDYTPPNKWVTQLAREWSNRYVWPRFVAGLPKEFFAAVRAELAEAGRSPSPQTREMGPIYTGKDVSFIDTKQANRQAESALLEAEKLASLALALGYPYPERAVDKAWRQLVFNAHHDGITGSESDQVYLDLLGGWREAYELAKSSRNSAMRAISSHVDTGHTGSGHTVTGHTVTGHTDTGHTDTGHTDTGHTVTGSASTGSTARKVVVFNSLSYPRSEVVEAVVPLPERGARSVVLRDGAGNVLPEVTAVTAYHPDGTAAEVRVQFHASDVPGLGYLCYGVERSGEAPTTWAAVEGFSASNERFLVEADPGRGGCLSRLVDRRTGRDVLAAGEVANELLVYPEYPQHPQMTEGPWHLLPAGPAVGSSARPARVHAERSPLGERLVIEGEMDVMAYTQVVTLLAGSDRVGLRTYLRGFSGVDRLVRLRFPVAADGATPLAEVGNAVVARSFGFVDADAATAPWTLDTPVQNWAGLGSTLALSLTDNGNSMEVRALGVAEVIIPAGAATALSAEVRTLLVALAAKGVTASCTNASSNRYGGLLGDSNLPDVRISLGSPVENELTASVLESAGPQFRAELERQLAERGAARLFVPPARPFQEVWTPNADVRGPRDLPVLILAGSDENTLSREIASFTHQVAEGRLAVEQPASLTAGAAADERGQAPGHTVAVLNQGTPGFLADTHGAIYISLLRSCTGWPSGVWIDPPRRTAPDGSNFELEHWDHVYEHALVTGPGDWRDNGCAWEGQCFNTPLAAITEELHPGVLPAAGSFLELQSPGRQVMLTVLKRVGNPLARGETGEGEELESEEDEEAVALEVGPVEAGALATGGAGTGGAPRAGSSVELTARLYESAGHAATATLSGGLSWKIERAWAANLLEETAEEVRCPDGKLTLEFEPAETRTVRLQLRRVEGASVAQPGRVTKAPALEQAQPTFSRYWLHNKGPAPMGNQLLAVHLGPTSVRVRHDGEAASLVATVASGAVEEKLAGNLEIVAPPGWEADPPSRLFNLAPGAHTSLSFRLSPPPTAKPGRFFVAASITDGAGQTQEDVSTVDLMPVDALGPYREEGGPLPPAFDHPSTQIAGEFEAWPSKARLVLSPGASASFGLVVANRTSSELRGEAQLVSPVETWSCGEPWTQGFTVPPAGKAEVPFIISAPADAGPLSSWLLVKVMYFGRLWYSPAVPFEIRP